MLEGPFTEPFVFIEFWMKIGHTGVIAYGAYGSPEHYSADLGGVALVDMLSRHILATKTIPHNPEKRLVEAQTVSKQDTGADVIVAATRRGYDFRQWEGL